MPTRKTVPEGYKLVRKVRKPSEWSLAVGDYARTHGIPLAQASHELSMQRKGGAARKRPAVRRSRY